MSKKPFLTLVRDEQQASEATIAGIPLMPEFEHLPVSPSPPAHQVSALPRPGGGGTSGGVTDDWKASVDRQLERLDRDVRALWTRGAAAAVVLAAMTGGLYLYTNEKFERVGERLTAMQVQQAKSDAKLDLIVERTAPKTK